MNRRQFTLTLAGCSVLGLSGFIQTHPIPANSSIVSRLFTHHDSAISLGKHYLALFPEEANYNWLMKQTLPSSTYTDLQTLKQILKTQRQQDFYESNTVMLEGWILSRTEARLCALLALT